MQQTSGPQGATTFQQRLLLRFCRDPAECDYTAGNPRVHLEGALDALRREYPTLQDLVRGNRVADFGCGVGLQSIALAREFEATVVGIDTHPQFLTTARRHAKDAGIPADQASFVDAIPEDMNSAFDVVISQNSFEHFDEPEQVLATMRDLIKPNGRILVSFGPPWYAPYGSHMNFFCALPWVHVLFPERTVMAVRSRFRSDGATRYEEVEAGLNRMSVARFERLVASSGLRVTHRQYTAVKGINVLTRIPALREFFITHLSVILMWK